MSFQGRSPINDVVRSVVLGAAMITPVALQGCAGANPEPPKPPKTDPEVTVTELDGGVPDPSVVRPRGPKDPTNMPTRGFSGGARVRG